MREKRHTVLFFILYLVFTVAIFISLSYGAIKVEDAMEKESTCISDDWFYDAPRSGNGIAVSEFVRRYSLESGKEYTLKGKLPKEIKDGGALYFYSQNLELTVTVDGKEIYTLMPDKKYSSTASVENIIPIPDNSEGKEVSIQYHTNGSYRYKMIDKVYLGEENAFAKRIFLTQLPLVLLALICICIALVQLASSIVIQGDASRQMFYLGWFSLLYGLWIFGASGMIDFMSDYHYSGQNIRHLALSMLTYPLLRHLYLRFEFKQDIKHVMLKVVTFFNFPIVFTLYMVSGVPLENSAIFTYVIIALSFLCLTMDIVKRFKASIYKSGREQGTLSFIGIVLFGIGGVADMLRFGFSIGTKWVFCSPSCFLVLTCILSYRSIQGALDMMKLGKRSETVKQLAYFDSLTEVYNRTALNEDMEKLEQVKSEKKNIGIVQFDVNNLKVINDTLGHLAGDKLLQAAAKVIKGGFEEYGKTYRFGGDEFVVIIEENAKEKYAFGIQQMENLINQHNKKCPKAERVSVVYGVSYFDESTSDRTLWQIQEAADEQMYERKRQMKAHMRSDEKSRGR